MASIGTAAMIFSGGRKMLAAARRVGDPAAADAKQAARLVEACRFADADRLLEDALARHPDDVRLARQHAFSAHNDGRYPAAFARWERVRRLDPDDALAWCGMSSNAREQGKIPVCAAIIDEALQRFPEDANVVGEAGRVAIRRGDHVAALALWRRACAFPVVHPDAFVLLVQTQIYLGLYEEAAGELVRARARYPDHRGLDAMGGLLAMAREDWDGALAIWDRFCALWPDDQTGWEQRGRTLALKDLAALDDAASGAVRSAPAMAPVPVGRVEDEAVRALLLGFESLGSDCEFGMVQRRYGAEPLGLLRWSATTPDSLAEALRSGFVGLGEPERTVLVDRLGYYATQDRRLGFATHTFMPVGEVDHDAFHAKMCRRIAFLRDKLVADLRTGEKCFVLKSDDVTADDLDGLYGLVRSLGPARLLLVRTAGQAAGFHGAAGEVVALRPGLFVGFIGSFGAAKGYWDIAFGEWLSICRAIGDKGGERKGGATEEFP